MLKILYSIVLVVILAGAAYVGFYWFTHDNSGLLLEFNGPESVPVGMLFDLEVGINNSSGQILNNAKLLLSLPKGMVFVGRAADENIVSRKVGNVGIGSLTTEKFQLLVLKGKKGDLRNITATIDYSPSGIKTRFQKRSKWQLLITGDAFKLEGQLPAKITSGKVVELKISYENTSPIGLEDLVLKIKYPKAFQFQRATLSPDVGNNEWFLGGLRAGSANDFIVIGKLVGPESGFFDFKVIVTTKLGGRKYVISQKVINTAIKVAPIDLKILANNSADHVVKTNEKINYSIQYRYLTRSQGNNPVVTAKLSGKMFDFDSLKIEDNGQLDSRTNIIAWQLDDGVQSGSVNFSIKTKSQYPIRRIGDRNFVLKVESQFEDSVHATISRSETKVIGQVEIEARGYFRDAKGKVVNSGSLPPQVGKPIEFSIHWDITNYATDVGDIRVSTRLPSYVKFVGVKSKTNGSFSLDEDSPEFLIWKIDKISATKGVISRPTTAIFQIRAVPIKEMVGKHMSLTGVTNIHVTDKFTNTSLSNSDDALTTQLPDDSTLSASDGIVVE
jgi:hypothetical protein